MDPKLIACRVLIEEMRPFLPETMATEILEISLHTRPEKLRAALQQAIAASDGLWDPIYLGYGLCGKAVVGLTANQSRLVFPKSDDCIAIFLGSRQERRRQLAAAPGTYFLTQGWIGDCAGSLFSDYDRMVEKYGRDKAEELVGRMLRGYTRLAYIRLPNAVSLEADRQYARAMASKFHLEYAEINGTPALLKRMIAQDWDDDMIVCQPGQPITIEQFLNFEKGCAARVSDEVEALECTAEDRDG